MKRARVLHLWRMPQLRKLDQLCTGDRLHRAFSQLWITPERRADLRRCKILTDRDCVLRKEAATC